MPSVPNLDTFLSQLRLSTSQFYNSAQPEQAAAYAGLLKQTLSRPRIRQMFQILGYPAESLLDQPTDLQGIKEWRAQNDAQQREWTKMLMTGIQDLPGVRSWPGMQTATDIKRRVAEGVQEAVSRFGLGAGAPEPLPGQTMQVPFTGQVDPWQLAGDVGANLALFASIGKFLTPTAPLALGGYSMAPSVGFGGAGLALSSAEELGQKLAKGDPVSAGRIMMDTATGAAAGLPLARFKAAIASGGTAALMSALTGEGGTPRITAEVLGALILGNAGHVPVKPVVEPAAWRFLGAELKGWMPKVDLQMTGGPAPDMLARMRAELGKPMDTVTKFVKNAEVQQVTNLAQKLDEFQLLDVARTHPNEGIRKVFADAWAQKTGRVRPTDAPADQITAVYDKMGTPLDSTSPPDTILKLLVGLRDNKLSKGRKDDAQFLQMLVTQEHNLLTKVMPGLVEGKLLARVGQTTWKGASLEQRSLMTYLDELAAARDQTDDLLLKTVSNLQAKPEQLKSLEDIRKRLTSRINDVLQPGFKPTDFASAQVIARAMVNSATSPAELDQLLKKLPEGFEKFHEAFTTEAKTRIDNMIRSSEKAAFERDMQDRLGKLAQFGVKLRDTREDAVVAMVEAIDAAKMPRGKIRQMGGVAQVMDNVASGMKSSHVKDFLTTLDEPGRKSFAKDVNKVLFGPKGTFGERFETDVRRRAFRQGMSLHKEGNNYLFLLGRYKREFPSLQKAHEYMNSIERGDLPDHLALVAQAQKGGMTIRHIGDDKWMMIDHVQGKGEVVDSRAAVQAKLAGRPDVIVQSRDLIPGTDIEVLGVQPMNAHGQGDVRFDYVMGPETRARLPKWELIRNLRDMQSLSQDIESAIPDVKAWSEFFEPASKVQLQRTKYEEPFVRELRSIRGLVRKKNYNAIQDLMVSDPKHWPKLAQDLHLSQAELTAAKRLRTWYEKLTSANYDSLKEAKQKARETASNPADRLLFMALPKELEFLRGSLESGRVNLGGDGFMGIASDVLRAKSNSLYLEPVWPKMQEVVDALSAKIHGNTTNQDYAFSMRVLQNVKEQLTDNFDKSAQHVADGLNAFIERWDKLGLLKKRFTSREIEQASWGMSSFFSGTAMSMRPSLVLRNLTQAVMPGFKIGFTRQFKAIIDISNPFKWKETVALFNKAKEAGVITETEGLYLGEQLQSLREGSIRTAQRIGLVPFRKSDTLTRLASFRGGYDAVQEFGPKLLKKDISLDKFLLDTGLAGDGDVVQARILRVLRKGDVEQASVLYGKHISDSTQFLYSRLAAPLHFQTVAGRMHGQFGIWPMAFTNFMMRNASPGLTSVGKGLASGGTRAAYGKRFIARWGAYVAALMGIEASTGIDTSSWNMSSPLDFEGGPYEQAVSNMARLVSGTEFEKSVAQRNLWRFASNALIPFRSAIYDWQEASLADDDVDRILLAMGWSLSGERLKRLQKAKQEAARQ